MCGTSLPSQISKTESTGCGIRQAGSWRRSPWMPRSRPPTTQGEPSPGGGGDTAIAVPGCRGQAGAEGPAMIASDRVSGRSRCRGSTCSAREQGTAVPCPRDAGRHRRRTPPHVAHCRRWECRGEVHLTEGTEGIAPSPRGKENQTVYCSAKWGGPGLAAPCGLRPWCTVRRCRCRNGCSWGRHY